jgi:monofunctional chorismate mutase
MKLLELRNRIDEIDKDILRLLELRFQVVKEIGAYKKANNLPILDVNREKEVLEMRKALLVNKENWPHFENLFKLIMKVSKDLEA